MPRRKNLFLLVAMLIACLGASSCGKSNPSITFRTEIKNASSIAGYDLDFEGGTSKLLLVPTERIPELELSVLNLGDITFITIANQDEFASIPLAEKIDIELEGIEPGSYALIVNSIHVSKGEVGGIMVLMVEYNGNRGLYGFDVAQDVDQQSFGPDESYLGFLR